MTGSISYGFRHGLAKVATCLACLAPLSLAACLPAEVVAGDSALLVVGMAASREEYPANGAINISFELNNISGRDQHLLLWGTPFEGMVTRAFVHVQFNGTQLPYRGPVVKRAAPRVEDFQRIGAGESINRSWDLKQLFEIDKPGVYVVSLPALIIQYRENGLEQMLTVDAHTEISFTIR